MGFGFIYLPATVAVATYFDKKRAFASGIASCGAGFGTFIFAPIINLLDDQFGWSWTLVMIGAVVLFCIPLGLIFKPIKDTKSVECCEGTDEKGDQGNTSVDCFGRSSVFITKIGNGFIELLSDMNFILFVLSNLLTTTGFAVPYAYTVASSNRKIILRRAQYSLKDYT